MSSDGSPEVLVLGAGIIGLACARELALGGRRVAVLEAADRVGSGATGAAAGMLSPLAEAPTAGPWFQACREARDLWRDWNRQVEAESGLGTGYDTSGTLLVALDEAQEAENRRLVEAARALGEPIEPMALSELRRLVPGLAPRVASAHLMPGDHRVDNPRTTLALAQAATRLGVEIHLNQRARRLSAAGEIVRVEGDGWHREAERVVIATGAWTGTLAGIAPLPVRPVRGQMVSIGEVDWPWTGVLRGPGLYAVRREGCLVAGATVEEAGFACQTTPAGQIEILSALDRLLPGLRQSPILSSWAGLRPGSPDDLPLLGPLAAHPRILVASGHYRNGILLAPWTAKVIAETLAQGTLPAGARPFDVNRFP